MGQLLSHPIEDKTMEHKSYDTITYCIGLMQGYRMSMEDAHNVKVNEDESLAVFGVFDGHGGKTCAEVVSDKLPTMVFRELSSLLKNGNGDLASYMKVLKDSFFRIDRDLTNEDSSNCGTTAIIASIIANEYIIVSNAGDSRCIMSLEGGAPKTLSFDHKPSTMGERVRIENSGGYVVNGRVNEILALSRAFGDFKFKLPYMELLNNQNKYIAANKKYFKHELIHLPPEVFLVSVEPDVVVYDLKSLKQPEFVVLACDGIWDCYTNTKLIKIIRDKLSLDWKIHHITEFILNDCVGMANNVTGIGFDNMTIIIVAVHNNNNIDEWYTMMKERVLKEKGLL